MERTETIAQLGKALAAAQGELKNAALDKVNAHFGQRYASLGSLTDAVRPVLARRFAPVAAQRDAVSAAIEARRVQAGHVDPRVRVMMDRLAHLRRSQLERHPMWHGFAVAPPPPQLQPPSSGAPPRAASKLN